MVVLCPVHVSVGQRYSSDGFLCLGDFFHHGLRDCASGVVTCQLHGRFLVFENFGS